MVKDHPDSHSDVASSLEADMDRASMGLSGGVVGGAIGGMGDEEYETLHWPVIHAALEQLLGQQSLTELGSTRNEAQSHQQQRISFEQTYTAVYKCVCRMHADRLYEDLMGLVRSHLRQVSELLHATEDQAFVHHFHLQLRRYLFAMTGITPIFTYMDRCYLAGWRRTDLSAELHRAFAEEVSDRYMHRLMSLVEHALQVPLGLEPSVAWELCGDLHRVSSEYGAAFPHVFSRYVPCVQPPMHEDELPGEAHRIAVLQSLLVDQGFTRGDRSRKRPNEDDSGGGGGGGEQNGLGMVASPSFLAP